MTKTHDDDAGASLPQLLDLICTLREKCPWDRKQTSQSAIVYLIEEVHELLSAVTAHDMENIEEEMGDVMFQLFFLLHLYELKGSFSLSSVIEKNLEKMIRRHPHVFEEAKDLTPGQIEKNWALIKAGEKKEAPLSVLDSVPKGLPSLQRAHMISDKVGRRGFDWDDMDGVMEKVNEEWAEFKGAMESGDKSHVAMEFGDLLFTLTNIARFAGIHPETALSGSIGKFEARYRHMEKALFHLNQSLGDLSAEEKDALWRRAKQATDTKPPR